MSKPSAKKTIDFADEDTPSGFPMALNPNARDYPRSLLELEVMAMAGAIRDKPGWWRKVHDETITTTWKEEALADAEDVELRERQFAYALAECQWLSQQYATKPARPAAVDRVFARDDIKSDLLKTLLGEIAVLRSRPAIGAKKEDRHPGTPQMVDLVHPSLWCYEGGKTEVLPNADPRILQAPAWEAFLGCKGVTVVGQSGQLQWLPSEFRANANGTHCEINSYINSLHPKEYPKLYESLASLFCHTVPLFEEVLAEAGNCFPDKTFRQRSLRFEIPYPWWGVQEEEARDQRSDESDTEYEEYFHNLWERQQETRRFVSPTIPTQFSPPEYNKERAEVCLSDRPLQVIVKIASLELGVGETYEGGTWHVEGTMTERIVATACCYLESTNVTGGELLFRTDVNEPYYEQDDHEGVGRMYGLENEQLLVQDLGHCSTTAGRVLAWPNTLQHCVAPVRLVDETKPGKRTIVCFFLVDPTLRVRSTATVPPQQLAWLTGGGVSPLLAAHGVTESSIGSSVAQWASDSTLSYEMACERRERLMEERGAGGPGSLATETFSLCEH